MGIDEGLTKEIVRRILSATSPNRIILFGSAASQAMTPESDLDLLIVEEAPKNTHEESVRIRSLIGGYRLSG
jgi:predicted nucleotidyltransferase